MRVAFPFKRTSQVDCLFTWPHACDLSPVTAGRYRACKVENCSAWSTAYPLCDTLCVCVGVQLAATSKHLGWLASRLSVNTRHCLFQADSD